MSLINQMLTDLDKRKTGSQDGGDSVPEPIPVAGTAYPNRRFLIWGGAAAVAVVAVLAVLLLWNGDSSDFSVQRDSANPAAPTEGQETAGRSPEAAENTETGITAEAVPASDREFSTETTEREISSLPGEGAVAKTELEKTPLPDKEVEAKQGDVPVLSQQQPQTEEGESDLQPIEPLLIDEPEPVASYKKPVKRVASKRESSFDKGQRYLRQGRLAEAESALRDALNQARNNHRARELLAGLLIRGGRSEEALQLLRDGALLAPQRPGFALLQARILMQGGEQSEAVQLLEQVVRGGSGNKQVITMLAVLYQQQKQHQRALELYRMLIEREPGLASNWVGAAISLEALGNPDEALSAYRRAVGLPELAQALRAYAADRIEDLGRNR
jgi:MSHA biogenesis protein MshN